MAERDRTSEPAAENPAGSDPQTSSGQRTSPRDPKSKLARARAALKKDAAAGTASSGASGEQPAEGAAPKPSKLAAARAARAAGAAKAKAAAEAGVATAVAAPTAPAETKAPQKPRPVRPVRPPVEAQRPSRRSFIAWAGSSITWAGVAWSAFTAACAAMLLGTARFMFPNWLREPPSTFKVGSPQEYPPDSVANRWKAQFGVWIVHTMYNGQDQIYAIRTVCTHLGCTPNWLDGERKFKCPCHGSGFTIAGINFEGPAPRPLERYAIRLADDGQLEVDKSRLFQQEMGQWEDPTSFVPV